MVCSIRPKNKTPIAEEAPVPSRPNADPTGLENCESVSQLLSFALDQADQCPNHFPAGCGGKTNQNDAS